MATLTVPRAWADITPDWMSRAVGEPVENLALDEIDEGTTSRTRARLIFASGRAPQQVFVKAQGSLGHRLLLLSIGGLLSEARLLAHRELLPLETPEVYGSAIDRRTLRTITVMEDVSQRGARPNVATTPLTPDEVANGLAGLARLHASAWGGRLPAPLSWVGPWRMTPGYRLMGALGPPKAAKKLRELGREDVLPSGGLSVSAGRKLFSRSSALARTGPQTLLHGDAHVGNSYSLPDGTVGFYDWQLVRTGSWSHDVGYFLGSALSVEDRRHNERELLKGYLEELGSAAPSFDEAWLRYRQTPAYGLLIWLNTIGYGGYQSDEICLTTIERFGRAFDDLDTATAVQ